MAPREDRKFSPDATVRIEAKLDETLEWIDTAKIRLDRLEVEAQTRKERQANRVALWAAGLGCGLIPSLLIVVLEHVWK